MKLTRGQFLAAAAVGGASLTGCTEVARRVSAPPLPKRLDSTDLPAGDPVGRVLTRVAYGPRPGDVQRVRAMGVDAYLEEQLHPEKIEEPWAAWMRLLPLDTLHLDAADAEDLETANYPEVGKGQAAVELQQAALLRAVYSARQLEQAMVEFWSDHFNVTQLKGECSWLKTVDDRLIRKHCLGRFRDLLSASAHSPAMLFYLDNNKNEKFDAAKKSGPNENYARELLELHTLGVDGGYTLKDIQEVARCLTGWSYKKGLTAWPGDFVFNRDQHDDGPKRVLGVTIPAGQGVKDGEQVLDIVCRHPSTARFIARKLCRRFVADRPPDALVARIARVFTRTDGDLRQVAGELFHSEEFQRAPERKLKRPFDFAVSALRGLNADTTGAGVLPYLERMGQLPYKWAMPDGYPERLEAWTPSLLARWNFAVDLAANRIPGTSVPADDLVELTRQTTPLEQCRSLSRMLHGRALPEAQLSKLVSLAAGSADTVARQWLALMIAGPEFQWR